MDGGPEARPSSYLTLFGLRAHRNPDPLGFGRLGVGLGVTFCYELTGPGIPIHRFRAGFVNHDRFLHYTVDGMGMGL